MEFIALEVVLLIFGSHLGAPLMPYDVCKQHYCAPMDDSDEDECIPAKNCDALLTIETSNSSELRFTTYLTHSNFDTQTNAKWFAVGLSEDQLMGNDFVTECHRNKDGDMNIYNSFNTDDRNNVAVNNVEGIRKWKLEALELLVICQWYQRGITSMRAKLDTGSRTKKIDLVAQQYYVLLAVGNMDEISNRKRQHFKVQIKSKTPEYERRKYGEVQAVHAADVKKFKMTTLQLCLAIGSFILLSVAVVGSLTFFTMKKQKNKRQYAGQVVNEPRRTRVQSRSDTVTQADSAISSTMVTGSFSSAVTDWNGAPQSCNSQVSASVPVSEHNATVKQKNQTLTTQSVVDYPRLVSVKNNVRSGDQQNKHIRTQRQKIGIVNNIKTASGTPSRFLLDNVTIRTIPSDVPLQTRHSEANSVSTIKTVPTQTKLHNVLKKAYDK